MKPSKKNDDDIWYASAYKVDNLTLKNEFVLIYFVQILLYRNSKIYFNVLLIINFSEYANLGFSCLTH